MTSRETLEILLQPFITTEQLARLIGKTKSTASKKMAEMHRQAMKEGKRTERGVVPSKRVIDYLQIDINELVENAKLENLIKGVKQ